MMAFRELRNASSVPLGQRSRISSSAVAADADCARSPRTECGNRGRQHWARPERELGIHIATFEPVRLLSILATALLITAGESPTDARSSQAEVTPVLDLDVGLAQNVEQPKRNIWQGIGQAGIVQLHQGHVQGVLTRYPTSESDVSSAQLAIRFARFRSAVATTQAFDAIGCSAAPARIAAWFELAAPETLAQAPDEVVTWTARGIRVFGLAGRLDSSLASSAFPSGPERPVGLTAVGRRVAETILRAGALVDVANLSDSAVLEVIDLAKQLGRPVIDTRGSSRSVRARPGSLADWQLRAIAQTGGVVALTLDRDALGDGPQTDTTDVLRQLEHLVRVAGPDAVALASGFETGAIAPTGLGSAARFPRLAEALVARGMARETVRKIFRDNAARVLCGQKPRAGDAGQSG
jgi:microsomal dipeptidase-like Zn-dependent dipeptidase